MPAYHSQFVGDYRAFGNFALLPLKTTTRGPAPPPADPTAEDIVDEAIMLFRANVLFRNFELDNNADRVLVYLIFYIQECLQVISKTPNKNEATKKLATLAMENFAIPGDNSFVLGGLCQGPASRAEADQLRQYMTQLRQEVGNRLIERVFVDGAPSKWWMCFLKKKFMNKSL